jgi:drug/metabolite transporter (DMT)-like permease
MGLYLLLFSLVTSSIDGLFAKKFYNNKKNNDPRATAVVQMFIVAGISALVYFLFYEPSKDISIISDPKILSVVVFNSVLIAVVSLAWHILMKKAPLSEVVILLSLSGFLTQITSMMFGFSTIDSLGIVGGLLVVLSVGIISYEGKKITFKGVLPYVLMNIIPWSISILLDDIIVSDYGISPMFYMIISYLFPGIIISLFFMNSLKNIRKVIKGKNNIIPLMVSAVSSFFSYFLIYTSYNLGVNATQANFILSTQVIISVLTGIIFLKEKKNPGKVIIAAVLSSIGIYLLS